MLLSSIILSLRNPLPHGLWQGHMCSMMTFHGEFGACRPKTSTVADEERWELQISATDIR
jgi:hypothetical protein